MATKTKHVEETDVLDEQNKILVLHNDDVNSFDHVIRCLVIVCKHSPLQAENCAFIVHHKGKCSVQDGTMEEARRESPRRLPADFPPDPHLYRLVSGLQPQRRHARPEFPVGA